MLQEKYTMTQGDAALLCVVAFISGVLTGMYSLGFVLVLV